LTSFMVLRNKVRRITQLSSDRKANATWPSGTL
jgi:hypothetical protein